MIKTTLITLIFVLTPFFGISRNLLTETAEKIASAPSVSTRFEASNQTGKVSGEAVIANKCFVIITDGGDYETWFDGKTQWTYNAATEEVSMTEPTMQEILEVNPLAMITNLSSAYSISQIGTSDSVRQKFRLTPTSSNSSIKTAIVTINTTLLWPVEISATLADNETLTIKFTDTAVGQKVSSDRFRYNPNLHPDAEIIDLR